MWLGRQKYQGHEGKDKPGGPLCPRTAQGIWTTSQSFWCSRVAWSLWSWSLQASQVLLRHNQVGQALERDQKPIAFHSRIALSHPGIAGIRMLLLSKGMNLLTMKPYASLLLISPTSKAYTYCCKSPVPNSGWHIKEVLSFDLKVFQPAGNITTWSSSAVLSGWSQ